MPYRRKFKKRRRVTVKKNARAIKRLKGSVELKRKDGYVTVDVPITTTATFIPLSTMDTGDGPDQREGMEIQNKKLMIRGFFNNKRGVDADVAIRVVIFRWHDPNATPAGLAWTSLFKMQLPNGGVTSSDSNLLALRNTDNYKRFSILYDESFNMDTSLHSYINFKFSTKLRSKTTYLKDPTGGLTVNDIITNSYYMCLLSNQATPDNAPGFTYGFRLTYVDL